MCDAGDPADRERRERGLGALARDRARARAHIDGYLWFGRPWLYMQTHPFDMHRVLAMARTRPY